MEEDILDSLKNLHQQATKERSHFYVGRTCERAFIEISALRDRLQMIAGIAEGSSTVNSLPHIVKIARGTA